MSTVDSLAAGGFQNAEKIHEGAQSIVFRARDVSNGRSVILKMLKEEVASPREVARYRREFEVIRSLDFGEAIKAFDLRPMGRSVILVEEDFGGESLRGVLRRRRAPLSEVLELAIQVVAHLERVHACHVVHKDVNPANIVWNSALGIVKLIDFGTATSFARESPGFEHPHSLVGTLAYISPEQTGRMNRAVDYRSDYYSFGATLYELLTGQTPFGASDVIELVHCHMARTPTPPHEIDHAVPEAVSRIVMKLLAKTAEERYQSARGIQADLETCLNAFRSTGTIEPFPLGRGDISPTLQISQKLYGRGPQIEAVLSAFQRSALGDRVLLLVSGSSGIGKTAVVHEVHRPITKNRGTFSSGKYDQMQRTVPNSAIVAAFRSLVRHVLSEDEASLSRWRDKLLAVLGPNGQVIIEVIPEVERIIGPQPPIRELGPAEAQARFSHVFRAFVRAFASAENPLVVFLDDLQWADASSIKLIELLMTDEELSHLLLIGAYRDNEVSAVHPTMILVDTLAKAAVSIERIRLGPLSEDDVAVLCADTLHRAEVDVRELAALVSRKTGGNPFFLLQFLDALYKKRLLSFDPAIRGFTWDESAIRAQGFTDNVVELIGDRLASLSERTREALRTAALLGNRFDLSMLAVALDMPEAEVFAALRSALDDEIIVPLSAYRRADAADPSSPLVIGEMRFAHDRVQQAAVQLVSEDSRAITHLKIGRLLRDHLPPEERDRKIFTIVAHLNFARALISEPEEAWRLVQLNVDAAEKALASQAAEAALECLSPVIEDGDAVWGRDPSLGFRVEVLSTRALALAAKQEEAEASARRLLQKIDEHLEGDRLRKTTAYVLLIRACTLMTQYTACWHAAAEALRLFGVDLPTENAGAAVGPLVGRIQELLAGRPPASLASLPETDDPEARAMMAILNEFSPTAYYLDTSLFLVVALHLARISLERGVTAMSASALAMYSLVVLNGGDAQGAAAVGRSALQIADRFKDAGQLSMCCNIYGSHVGPWVEHVRAMNPSLDRGCQAGVLDGVPNTSSLNLNNKMMNNLFEGLPLADLIEKGWEYRRFSAAARNTISHDVMSAVQLAMLSLAGRTESPLAFSMEGKVDAEWLELWRENKSNYAIVSFLVDRAMIHVLYGDVRRAEADLETSEPLLPFVSWNVITAKHALFTALAHARLLAELGSDGRGQGMSEDERQRRREKLSALHAQVRKWAEICPQNFLHMALFIGAEIERIEGRTTPARELYEEAIGDARVQGFIHHEAMLHERLATLLLSIGRTDYAKLHLSYARRGYENWGAANKVADLDHRYAEHLAAVEKAPGNTTLAASVLQATKSTTRTQTTGTSTMGSLDLLAVMRAAQSIAETIVLEDLLGKLMQISLEIAGAEGAALLLLKGDVLTVVAEGSSGSAPDRRNIPLMAWERGPRSILSFVQRTLESVIVADALKDDRFLTDRTIEQRRVRSLLAMPIVKQGRLIGALYLENNLASDVFTSQRVDILHVLAGQMAISLENARLYDELSAALAAARASEKLKSQFLANTSHELRTPLNAIINVPESMLIKFLRSEVVRCNACGSKFQLEEGERLDRDTPCISCGKPALVLEDVWSSTLEPREIAHRLRAIENSGRYLLTIVDSILEFSRIEAGHMKIRLENVDVRALFGLIEQSLSPLAAPKDIKLSFVLPERGASSIVADQTQLRQILNNLIGNAIKFSPRGTEIEIRWSIVDGETYELSVKDEGIGIDREHQEIIFESFRQVDGGDTRTQGGTGLGLAIAKKLTEMHGGVLSVESELGKGSTFRAHLPLKGPRATSQEVANESVAV